MTRHALIAVAALLAALLAGCVQDPRPAPTTTRDLSAHWPGDAPTMPMTPVALNSHADFDAFEDKMLVRMRPETLIAVYESLAVGARAGEVEEDALLLLRLAMLHLRSGADQARLQLAFAVADRLRTAAPDSPHTHFVHAHVTSLLLQVEDDGTYTVSPTRRDIANRQVEHWTQLLAVAPDYAGPEGWSGHEVRAALGSLKAALGSAPDAAPDTAAAPPAGVEAAAAAARARRDLESFEAGNKIARRTMCRDREEGADARRAPSTEAWRWLALKCAVELDRPDRALESLAALVRTSAAIDACRWLTQVGGGADALAADLQTALREQRRPPCP